MYFEKWRKNVEAARNLVRFSFYFLIFNLYFKCHRTKGEILEVLRENENRAL